MSALLTSSIAHFALSVRVECWDGIRKHLPQQASHICNALSQTPLLSIASDTLHCMSEKVTMEIYILLVNLIRDLYRTFFPFLWPKE